MANYFDQFDTTTTPAQGASPTGEVSPVDSSTNYFDQFDTPTTTVTPTPYTDALGNEGTVNDDWFGVGGKLDRAVSSVARVGINSGVKLANVPGEIRNAITNEFGNGATSQTPDFTLPSYLQPQGTEEEIASEIGSYILGGELLAPLKVGEAALATGRGVEALTGSSRAGKVASSLSRNGMLSVPGSLANNPVDQEGGLWEATKDIAVNSLFGSALEGLGSTVGKIITGGTSRRAGLDALASATRIVGDKKSVFEALRDADTSSMNMMEKLDHLQKVNAAQSDWVNTARSLGLGEIGDTATQTGKNSFIADSEDIYNPQNPLISKLRGAAKVFGIGGDFTLSDVMSQLKPGKGGKVFLDRYGVDVPFNEKTVNPVKDLFGKISGYSDQSVKAEATAARKAAGEYADDFLKKATDKNISPEEAQHWNTLRDMALDIKNGRNDAFATKEVALKNLSHKPAQGSLFGSGLSKNVIDQIHDARVQLDTVNKYAKQNTVDSSFGEQLTKQLHQLAFNWGTTHLVDQLTGNHLDPTTEFAIGAGLKGSGMLINKMGRNASGKILDDVVGAFEGRSPKSAPVRDLIGNTASAIGKAIPNTTAVGLSGTTGDLMSGDYSDSDAGEAKAGELDSWAQKNGIPDQMVLQAIHSKGADIHHLTGLNDIKSRALDLYTQSRAGDSTIQVPETFNASHTLATQDISNSMREAMDGIPKAEQDRMIDQYMDTHFGSEDESLRGVKLEHRRNRAIKDALKMADDWEAHQ